MRPRIDPFRRKLLQGITATLAAAVALAQPVGTVRRVGVVFSTDPRTSRPYLDKLPNDPWGRPYQYVNPGVKGEIDVFSFGADGQPGGEGKDADVGSWQ